MPREPGLVEIVLSVISFRRQWAWILTCCSFVENREFSEKIDRRHGMPFEGLYPPAVLVNRKSNALLKGSMLK